MGLKRRRFDQAWLYWGTQAIVVFTYAIYAYSFYLQKNKNAHSDIVDDGMNDTVRVCVYMWVNVCVWRIVWGEREMPYLLL
jgi:hypothetical protein